MILTKYEIEVLKILLKSHFTENEINTILISSITAYEITDAGYFLELSNEILPMNRQAISHPVVYGKGSNYEVGFVLFLENRTLTIECHSWGGNKVPKNARSDEVNIEII